MIEIRWLERFVKQGHFYPDLLVRVLQSRQRDENALGMLPGKWSDWQDVPTVREE